jgi:hypothetical protein
MSDAAAGSTIVFSAGPLSMPNSSYGLRPDIYDHLTSCKFFLSRNLRSPGDTIDSGYMHLRLEHSIALPPFLITCDSWVGGYTC